MIENKGSFRQGFEHGWLKMADVSASQDRGDPVPKEELSDIELGIKLTMFEWGAMAGQITWNLLHILT